MYDEGRGVALGGGGEGNNETGLISMDRQWSRHASSWTAVEVWAGTVAKQSFEEGFEGGQCDRFADIS